MTDSVGDSRSSESNSRGSDRSDTVDSNTAESFSDAMNDAASAAADDATAAADAAAETAEAAARAAQDRMQAEGALANSGLAERMAADAVAVNARSGAPMGTAVAPSHKQDGMLAAIAPQAAAMASPAALGTMNVPAATIGQIATQIPPAQTAPRAPTGILGRVVGRVLGGAIGGILSPSPIGSTDHIHLGENLRASIHSTVMYGSIEKRVDGEWVDTGIGALRDGSGGVTFDAGELVAQHPDTAADIERLQGLDGTIVMSEGTETIGNNPRPAGGRINTDKEGGEAAAEEDFGELAEEPITEQPDGTRVGANGVRIRTGGDGRPRVDIPADVGPSGSHETIHYND